MIMSRAFEVCLDKKGRILLPNFKGVITMEGKRDYVIISMKENEGGVNNG